MLEALDIIKNNPSNFDLIITDMSMPQMTGDKLALEILKIRSNIPIIICTGFSERVSKEQALTIGIKGFLMRPVVKADIADEVRRVLDEVKNKNSCCKQFVLGICIEYPRFFMDKKI